LRMIRCGMMLTRKPGPPSFPRAQKKTRISHLPLLGSRMLARCGMVNIRG
jgi:hypothetical protein